MSDPLRRLARLWLAAYREDPLDALCWLLWAVCYVPVAVWVIRTVTYE